MVRSGAAILALCGLALSAHPAAAFTAANGFRVTSDGPRSFVVADARGRSGDTDYWCAAGDFVIRSLGLRPGTRLFRLTAPPVRGGSVRFSLDPAGAKPTGLTVLGSTDGGLSAALAQVYCDSMQQDLRRGR